MPDHPIALNLARVVLKLVLEPRGWRVDLLQSELGIADRTWRKYRALLTDHFEHRLDPSGRWRIRQIEDGNVSYIRLLPDDGDLEAQSGFRARLAALWFSRRIFDFVGDGELGEALDEEWADLREGFGDKKFWLGHHMLLNTDRLLHVIADAPKDYRGREDDVATLLSALFYRRKLSFRYLRADGTGRRQTVCPLTLVMWRSGLYLVAKHAPESKPYVYAVERMEGLERRSARFDYPDPAAYDPAKLFEGSFGIWQDPDAKPTDVDLIFANERWLHRYLRERTWHESQLFEELEDGRLRMTFTVSSTIEVWPWVRSFDDQVEIVKLDPAPTRKSGT